MSHPNAERLEAAYKALDAGDMQTIDQLWTDDIVWHIYGEDGPLPGDYRGKQAILGMLGSIPQKTDDFDLQLHDTIANDRHAVALVHVTVRRKGITHNAKAVHVYHVDDTGRFNESWHALIDNRRFPDGFWTD